LNQENPSTEGELNGFIEKSPIYVTTYPPGGKCNGHAGTQQESQPEPELELKQDLEELEQSRPVPPHLPPPPVPTAPLPNGGTELLIGPQDQTRIPQDTNRYTNNNIVTFSSISNNMMAAKPSLGKSKHQSDFNIDLGLFLIFNPLAL
jgi:hypothetical protein